jgi:hypothetical protein
MLNLTIAAFCVLDDTMDYGRFKCVIEMKESKHLNVPESRNVNIGISSTKIEVIPAENYW